MKFKITCLFLILTLASGLASAQIAINEIMYNSDGPDVEFIELYNASAAAQNLTDWYVLDDNDTHDPCLLSGTLDPGGFLIIAADINMFTAKYPGTGPVNPNDYDRDSQGWALGNGGDAVRLFDASDNLIDMVAYDDGGLWPSSPDGSGPSLELLNPNSDNSNPTSWDPSTITGGTPGAVNSVYTSNIEPTCKDGERSIPLPTSADDVIITVLAFDPEDLSSVVLFADTGSGYTGTVMFDNGINGDAAAGDSIYTAVLPALTSGTLVKYYAVATDAIGQTDAWPNNAPADYHAYTVDHGPPALKLTEVLAVNNSVKADEYGEFDDWFEIHNSGSETVSLAGLFVGNSLGDSRGYKLPDISIDPDEYLLFWADNTPGQGDYHVDFKLASGGEAVGIFETVDHGNVLIHGWKYGRMSGDISMGLNPENGTAPEYLETPTPGASNITSGLFSSVCINEFLATSGYGGPDDWVELYNRDTESFDLSGCFLSDQRGDNTKWTFPEGTILDPGEFLVVYEDALGFGFSSDGDDVIMLTSRDSTTGLDFYDFGPQQADKTEGRNPDGVNNWQFFNEPTRGYSNLLSPVRDGKTHSVPDEFILRQNYPNPFNSSTVIRYALPAAGTVKLTVYNNSGQRVKQLINAIQPSGQYQVHWDGGNESGAQAGSGVYLCRMQTRDTILITKMILIR